MGQSLLQQQFIRKAISQPLLTLLKIDRRHTIHDISLFTEAQDKSGTFLFFRNAFAKHLKSDHLQQEVQGNRRIPSDEKKPLDSIEEYVGPLKNGLTSF
jgi:hypothetical protein